MTTANWFPAAAPVVRGVRAYFAPVNRASGHWAVFDPAEAPNFDLDCPPAPWIGLGWAGNFARKSASRNTSVQSGVPAAAVVQVRESLEVQVSLDFLSWTKLTMTLATGSQHMNVLTGDAAPLEGGSTASFLALSKADAAKFTAGQVVAVDVDYNGQTGFVGTPVAGAYVRQALSDADYTRRVTLNVAMVAEADEAGLKLVDPLPGGVPQAGAAVQALSGFVDREGGSFFHEWSGLFVMEGSLGERIFFFYPRLQASVGAEESALPLSAKGRLARIALKGQWLALPVIDPLDGERVVCYRSFVPARNAKV